MSYTPTTWTTGDTITATKLNKMEQGIANAGGGIDALVYQERGTGDWQIIGDFASAIAKVEDGVPLIAMYYVYCNYTSVDVWWYGPQMLGVYHEDNTSTINLTISSVDGFTWSANGIVYYD